MEHEPMNPLRRARELAGQSQEDLALICDVSGNWLRHLETWRQVPSERLMLRIWEYVGANAQPEDLEGWNLADLEAFAARWREQYEIVREMRRQALLGQT